MALVTIEEGELAELRRKAEIIDKYGMPTCGWVSYDQEDGCPITCGNQRPCKKHDKEPAEK